mgnify:CR=1 FL=1
MGGESGIAALNTPTIPLLADMEGNCEAWLSSYPIVTISNLRCFRLWEFHEWTIMGSVCELQVSYALFD